MEIALFIISLIGFILLTFTYILLFFKYRKALKKFTDNEIDQNTFVKSFSNLFKTMLIGILVGAPLFFVFRYLFIIHPHIDVDIENFIGKYGIAPSKEHEYFQIIKVILSILAMIVILYSLFIIIYSLYKVIRTKILLNKNNDNTNEAFEKNEIILLQKHRFYLSLLLINIIANIILLCFSSFFYYFI